MTTKRFLTSNGVFLTKNGHLISREQLVPWPVNCAAFNGAGAGGRVDFSDASLNVELSALTFEMWLYPITGGGTWSKVFVKQNTQWDAWPNSRFTYSLYANRPEVGFPAPLWFKVTTTANVKRGMQSNYVVPVNTWTHVACTHDGRISKIYINGVLDATSDFSTVATIKSSIYPLVMGRFPWGTAKHCYNGRMDDVRIWHNTARTIEEINAYMRKAPPLTHPNLACYVPFNESPVTNLITGVQATLSGTVSLTTSTIPV